MASASRTAVGRIGEAAAQQLLERRGYRIVDVNVRFGKTRGLIGEIDIVAWDGPTLCFVEVKTRRQQRFFPGGSPAEAVTPAKQRQITRLALAYAGQHELLAGDADEVALRFDVVSVVLSPGRDEEAPATVRRADLIQGAFLAPDDWDEEAAAY